MRSSAPPSAPRASSAPAPGPAPRATTATTLRFAAAFFLFGTLNNISYVIILTAALELMPRGVPTGVVAFANIFPALCAKAIFPYFLRGEVRYRRRVWACSALTFGGMLMIAWFESALMRLLGISIASFCSGLGELTWLQLATRFGPHAGEGVGWFASGTGAAGFLGASAWWVVRPLGVKGGLSLLAVLPWMMAVCYFVLLPKPEVLIAEREGGAAGARYAALAAAEEEEEEEDGAPVVASAQDEDDEEDEDSQRAGRRTRAQNGGKDAPLSSTAQHDTDADAKNSPGLSAGVSLAFSEKMELLRPMLFVFVLPLAIVYLAEYTINQGVAPTLIYPLPTRESHPILARFIKKLADYYPLYQLCYQTFVFISRSSISVLRLPAIPKRFLWLPTIIQCLLFLLLTSESLYAWFSADIASPLTIFLICIEGLAGGSAYVSVFHQIAMSDPTKRIALPTDDDGPSASGAEAPHPSPEDTESDAELARRVQQQEFRIACIGVADTLGICLASLVSMPIQVGLCNAQVRRGRGLCKQV
ncbi:battenin CLN3 protein [Tilletia horrida]|nr:battenin CLN3 protein [Tilletia horrida]